MRDKSLKEMLNRDFAAANAVAVAVVSLLLFFPREGSSEAYILALGAELVLPFCFVRLVLGRSIWDYGFSWGNRGILLNTGAVFLGLAVFLPGVWLFFSKTSLGYNFVIDISRNLSGVHASFFEFLLYTGLSLWFVGLNEIFFRGFFLFTWKRSFGGWALLAHAVFFGVFLYLKVHNLSPTFIESSLLVFGIWSIVAASIAFFTESVLVAFCFSMLSDILTTVFVIALS